MLKYYAVYKPFQMLCQFSTEGEKKTLADLDFQFQKDIYPVGRLDFDSEGLLILTNDKKLNHALLNPLQKHEREYWVQVEGLPDKAFIHKIENGVGINVDGKMYKTLHCKCKLLDENEVQKIPPRNPPIRFRKNVADTWISLILYEGKNRQVRKMTAACDFPTLRLIRVRIEKLEFPELIPNEIVEFEQKDFLQLLHL